jgi:hypothetical protein
MKIYHKLILYGNTLYINWHVIFVIVIVVEKVCGKVSQIYYRTL